MYNPPDGCDPLHFLSSVSNTLNDKTAQLEVPLADLLAQISAKQFETFLSIQYPGKPSLLGSLIKTGPALLFTQYYGAALALASYEGEKLVHRQSVGKIRKLLPRLTIRRPILSLDDRELGIIRAMGQLTARRDLTIDEWNRFLARVAWGDGTHANLTPHHADRAQPRVLEAANLVPTLVQQTMAPYPSVLAEAANRVLALRTGSAPLAGAGPIPDLASGARFMTREEMQEDTASLTLKRIPASLCVGLTNDDQASPVYYNGNESLITIASSGAGKTTSQVIRNLLTYPGSAIVLDVKGELWEKTAGHRAATFGKVYRFSPTDKQQRSNRFNPFDFISSDPGQAPSDCGAFSYQVIANNPALKDPYWDSRARNFLWAFATTIALSAPQSSRNLSQIARYLSLDTGPHKVNKKTTVAPETEQVLKLMEALGAKHGIDDLRAAATAIRTGIKKEDSDRLESVFDTARSHIDAFAREPFAQRAMASSDWHPLDLRRHPGTTVYIALPIADIPAYAPILRLIFFQHMHLLLDHEAKRDEPPITFFLDEMPRLGNFQSILQMQATGRSAGLRLWMFAQNLRQLKDAYGLDAGEGIPEDARVRCYMQPDEALAEAISKRLGETSNMLTGRKGPLASPTELSGPEYADKIITFSRASRPAILKRRGAHEDLSNLIKRPPPVKRLFA